MGWTVKPSRRRDRLRHRPHLESLDDRCLLSTGLQGQLVHVAPTLRLSHTAQSRAGHASALQEKGAGLMVKHQGHPALHRERLAGTETVSSAGAAYDSIIGASQVQSSYNVNGSGMTVAVIDTGIDSNNAALGGSFGPGAKVVAGFDFSNTAVANPPDSSNATSTSSPHGTGVAGLIGSESASDPGVAPGVDLVDLKVTDSSNTASLQSIANALQWVVNNHAQYNISVVNMSLSDGQNYAHNWFATTGGVAEQVTNLIGQLRAMNIPVVVATGNNFTGAQGEGFAAIVQGTISVTATDLSGHLLANAQRLGSSIGGSSATVIAAPGDDIQAPYGDNQTATVDGTSFSAALVSGSVVLLQQIYQQRFGALPSVDQIQQWLQNGSDPIHDPTTGITIGQLDIPKSAALIPSATAANPASPQLATSIQVSTAAVVPTPSTAVTQTLTTTTASTPTPTPTPAPTPAPAAPAPSTAVTQTLATTTASTPTPAPAPPAPANPPTPAPSNYELLSAAQAGADGSAVSQPLSGLAKLLQSMKVWQASSAGRS
jgi:subtilisin family serine protease